ncbi:MAG: polysaccharide deacetylase family protein [Bacteroidales bacterium]
MKSLMQAVLILVVISAQAQEKQTLAQKLGYEKDAILLIVHADDLGLAQSVNEASIEAFSKGGITSGSVMVPCPWTPDFARYYRSHPGLDVGIHSTLNAEWEYYRWDGVLSSTEIPSLLDEEGYLHATVEAVAREAEPAEVEQEVRAQIERAIALEIQPSHLDTHMGSIAAKPEFFQIYLKLGREYQLPVLMPRYMTLQLTEDQRAALTDDVILLDGLFMMNQDPGASGWANAYENMIGPMKPGLNQLIVHLAHDNDEMKAITVDHPEFGSAWRQRDLDFVTGEAFRNMLKSHGIQLVGWKQIQGIMYP